MLRVISFENLILGGVVGSLSMKNYDAPCTTVEKYVPVN